MAIARRQQLLHQLDHLPDRRQVAIHAIQALDGHEDVPAAVAQQGIARDAARQLGSQIRHGIVREGHPGARAAQPHALVHAGVDARVVQDEVAGLGHAREEAGVGVEARVEEQAGGRAVEARDAALQLFGIGGVAVQEPRAAAPEPKAGVRVQLLEVGGSEVRRGGQG